MARPIISVESLGKKYVIAHDTSSDSAYRYRSLRDEISSAVRHLFRKRSAAPPSKEEVWAISNVSFDVQPGEVLGVIGRNGAGKSTLLKLLSRITEPTTGRIHLCGRVASLLEVGTGFHPELTGRENIYLNGVIMGMTRREIARKFDAIVDFAEIERFLDTPVKRYSSGMYMRLAFSVAAHLDPEILIVDEVLAVGDVRFQRKCLDKMSEVGAGGRTVLFVSHNMPAVSRLCSRGMLLDDGKLNFFGSVNEAVSRYLQAGVGTIAHRVWSDPRRAPGNSVARLNWVCVKDHLGEVSDVVNIRYPVTVEMEYEVLTGGMVLVPNLHFYTDQGVCAFVTRDCTEGGSKLQRTPGVYRSRVIVPANYLSEATYLIGVALSTMTPVQVHFWERNAIAFRVVDEMDGHTARGDFPGEIPGVVRPLLAWETETAAASVSQITGDLK